MTNALTKDVVITYIPGDPGVPGSPYVPAQPSYTYTAYQCPFMEYDSFINLYVIYYVEAGSLTMIYTDDPSAYCEPTTVTVASQPAIAAVAPVAPTESQTIISNNIGWNSGAISGPSLTDSGGFAWKVTAGTTGMVAGFAAFNTDTAVSRITHGFYYATGKLSVMEGGAVKQANISNVSGDVLRVQRFGTQVTYWVNNTLVFTSAVPSSGTVYLDVSLYTAGDSVYDPALYAVKELSANVTATANAKLSGQVRGTLNAAASTYASIRKNNVVDLAATASAAASASAAITLTGLLSATASAAASVDASMASAVARVSMLPLSGNAGAGVLGASVNVAMEAVTSISYASSILPTINGANIVLYPLGGTAHGLTGTVGQVYVSFEPMVSLAGTGSYASAETTMLPLTSTSSALPAGLAVAISSVAANDSLAAERLLYVVMNSSLTTMATIEVTRLIDAEATSQVSANPTMSLGGSLLNASILEAVRAVTDTMVAGEDDAVVWVINRRTGATWRYEGYNFTRYLQTREHSYGVKQDGIYLLDGDLDIAAPIQASVDFGRKNFGTTLAKRLESIYLTADSDGDMSLRVEDDSGNEYFYTVRGVSPLDTTRAELGRGLRANYYSLQLYNVDGADFELANIEFLTAVLKRRL